MIEGELELLASLLGSSHTDSLSAAVGDGPVATPRQAGPAKSDSAVYPPDPDSDTQPRSVRLALLIDDFDRADDHSCRVLVKEC